MMVSTRPVRFVRLGRGERKPEPRECGPGLNQVTTNPTKTHRE